MDRDSIASELAKPLDSALVKPPPPGKYGDYVPAFDIITTANRIFEWDGWAYSVNRLEQTNCDPNQGKNSDQWAIGYMAVVTVEASATPAERNPVPSRQDVGHGQGHSKSLGDAHDSAMKEAVTDALKRALRTFGSPLGLALYDKTQAHVSDDPDAPERLEKATAKLPAEAIQKVIDTIKNIWGEGELVGYWTGLKDEQPGMQSAPGVAEAKDAQKAAISERNAA